MSYIQLKLNNIVSAKKLIKLAISNDKSNFGDKYFTLALHYDT